MDLMHKYKIILLNKLFGHINVTLYIHAVLKYTFRYSTIKEKKLLLSALAIIISPVFYFTILFFKLYRFIICFILKLKYGNDFLGLLDGTDVIFAVDESVESRSVITVLALVEFAENNFFEKTKNEIIKIFSMKKFEKLRCTKEHFMGYYFYKKNYELLETFVKEFPICKNMDELQIFLSEVGNKKMPLCDKGMWEAYVSKFDIKRDIKKTEFPIIFRLHHCFGDAITVFNMFSNEFSKRHDIIKNKNNKIILRKIPCHNFENSFIKAFGLIDKPDRSILCGAKMSGNKHFIWFSDKNDKYFNMVKRIKNKIKGITFVDVILTAFSASLTEYIEMKTDLFPSIANIVVTLCSQDCKLNDYGKEIYTCDNKFTIGMVKLPLKTANKTTELNIKERLNFIHNDYSILKNESLDKAFNRWQGRVILTFLPSYFVDKMIKMSAPSGLFSNIPGCQTLIFFGNYRVSEFVMFDPNVATSGISLMVTSYENRLNFAFTLDKTVIPELQDGKNLCNNILKHLESMDNSV